MKIRQGFVSNSSTSSFLIYGISIDPDDVITVYNKKYPELKVDEDEEEYDYYEMIEKLLQNTDLSMDRPWDEYYIGCSWSDVKDHETGLQFKQRVEKQLQEIFGSDIECDTYSEAWHD